MLGPFRDTENLWRRAVLQPQNWTFWHPGEVDPNVLRETIIIVAGLAVPLIGLILRRRSAWAVLGLACALLSIGLIPAIWSLPVLKSVQFPFRLLPVAEFALATGLAMVPSKETQWAPALIPVIMTAFIVTAPAAPPAISVEELPALIPTCRRTCRPASGLTHGRRAGRSTLPRGTHGPVIANGITTEPVFYFPAWKVRCGGAMVATFPAPTTQFLSYRGTGCGRSLGTTPPERWGTGISLAALLLLVFGQPCRPAIAAARAFHPRASPKR